MLIKTNTTFKIEDFSENNGEIILFSNIAPDFNILKESKTLEISPRIKTAKVVKIAPKEDDFLYIRNRAVSAGNVIDDESGNAELIPMEEFYKNFEKWAKVCRGANDNGDFFTHEELVDKYKTFIGKAVFVDHNNENVENARGIILDAVYNERGKFVELLKAIDKKAYPELARAIQLGYIDSTSMGCRCGYSICSICQNKAVTEDDFCDHISKHKGSIFNGLPVFEDNREIDFFEDSFVGTPADRSAKVLEKVANKRLQSEKIFIENKKNIDNEKVINEINCRTFKGKVENIKNNLKDLPWN